MDAWKYKKADLIVGSSLYTPLVKCWFKVPRTSRKLLMKMGMQQVGLVRVISQVIDKVFMKSIEAINLIGLSSTTQNPNPGMQH